MGARAPERESLLNKSASLFVFEGPGACWHVLLMRIVPHTHVPYTKNLLGCTAMRKYDTCTDFYSYSHFLKAKVEFFGLEEQSRKGKEKQS